jgi:hypothetical protein
MIVPAKIFFGYAWVLCLDAVIKNVPFHLLTSIMNTSSILSFSHHVFVDTDGIYHVVKDVSAAGDCSLISLLCKPNLHVPLLTCNANDAH